MNRTLSWQLAAGGLALVLLTAPFSHGLFFAQGQRWALLGLALALAIAAWSLVGQGRLRLFRHPLDWLALALPAAYLAALPGAANYGLALDALVRSLLGLTVYLLVVQLGERAEDRSRLLQLVYAAAVGVALAGLATTLGLITITDGFVEGRIYSTFQYPNTLAAFLGAALYLGWSFWLQEPVAAARPSWSAAGFLYAGLNFLLLLVFLGTKSRGGILFLGMTLPLYLGLLPWSRRLPWAGWLAVAGGWTWLIADRLTEAAAAGATGSAGLWLLLGLLGVLAGEAAGQVLTSRQRDFWRREQRLSTLLLGGLLAAGGMAVVGVVLLQPGLLEAVRSYDFMRNVVERTYFMRDALAMIAQRPLLGWGGGGWSEAYRSFQQYLYDSREVHSFYLQVAVETGLLGLSLVIGIGAAFFWGWFKSWRRPAAERLTEAAVLAAVLLLAGHAAIDFDLSLGAVVMTLWALLAVSRAAWLLAVPEPAAGGKKPHNRYPAETDWQARLLGGGAVLLGILAVLLVVSGIYQTAGVEQLRQGVVEPGLADLKLASWCNPATAEPYTIQTQVFLQTNQPAAAVSAAEKALARSRFDAQRKADLALAYLKAGQNVAAAAMSRQAVAAAPYQLRWYEEQASVAATAGRSELQAGRPENARPLLAEVLTISSGFDSRMAALNDYEQRLWTGPRLEVTPRILLFSGQARYFLGDWQEAEADLTKIQGDPALAGEAAFWLALLKDQQGEQALATSWLERARAVNPRYSEVFAQYQKIPLLSRTGAAAGS